MARCVVRFARDLKFNCHSNQFMATSLDCFQFQCGLFVIKEGDCFSSNPECSTIAHHFPQKVKTGGAIIQPTFLPWPWLALRPTFSAIQNYSVKCCGIFPSQGQSLKFKVSSHH